MDTVAGLIRTLLPKGSGDIADNWSSCPIWPPDVFAVACTLIERSSSYTYLASGKSGGVAGVGSRNSMRRLENLAKRWRGLEDGKPEEFEKLQNDLNKLWSRLFPPKEAPIDHVSNGTDWCIAAHKLLIVADMACAGMGFKGDPKSMSWIQALHARRTIAPEGENTKNQKDLTHPATACIRVPETVCCVQPKTRTPGVGCTTRSLSHHLALLPPKSVVHVSWHPTYKMEVGHPESAVNLLVIPYPFTVSSRAIKGKLIGAQFGRFTLDQSAWCGSNFDSALKVVEWILHMIEQALLDIDSIQGIVLPELAINDQIFDELVIRLCNDEYKDIEFLVAGVGGEQKNAARTTWFMSLEQEQGRTAWHADQCKHHRWKLDGPQINDYAIGSALDPRISWWEDVEIADRSLDFFVMRRGACFTTLICEDLARIDPCQSVIRSIGPNLVIALLMDGPQLSHRWPGRYAMSLADDPGCSVLSLTSLGLMRRSNFRYQSSRQVIGLWRDSAGTTRELDLPGDAQGLVLTLNSTQRHEFTLDGRDDGGAARVWQLTGSVPVKSRQELPIG